MRLSEVNHPNQLHGLTTAQLEDVACQIRERHLQVVSTSGGHLGPGLGVVELTLALYQTLDLDVDKVVWDVGHQAYPHKLITGRYSKFDSLRQQGGVADASARAVVMRCLGRREECARGLKGRKQSLIFRIYALFISSIYRFFIIFRVS